MKHQSKKINLVSAVAFAVGAMIGGGVFVLSGVALKQTGPSAIISFLFAGFCVLLSALSFAVIASCANKKASGYDYVGVVLGSPIWSFLTSWCFYLGGIIGAAFVLNAFGTYMNTFIDHNLSILIWAIVGAIILTALNFGPASEIGRIESFLVGVKLLILILLVVFGFMHFQTHDLKPFTPHGLSEVFVTSAFLFIAFLGFNVITSISSDIEDPASTIPKAILLSMLIVTIVYVGIVVALVTAHIKTYSEASVGVAAKQLIGPVGGGLVIVGALISTLSSANANILGSSEIMVRLAADKQVPTILGRMKRGHPYVSVLAGGLFYLILILSKQTETIIGLANVTAIVALIIVNLAAAKAISSPDYRGMKIPLKRTLPILGTVFALSQFFFMPLTTLVIGLVLSLGGCLIYLGRERYHMPAMHLELKAKMSNLDSPLGRVFFK